MAKATKKMALEIDADKADLVQAAADQRGKTVSELLEAGESVQGLANDQAHQALGRLIQRGVYPAEIVAEAKAEAARQVAARTPAASTGAAA